MLVLGSRQVFFRGDALRRNLRAHARAHRDRFRLINSIDEIFSQTDAPLPRELYAALIAFISEIKKPQYERASAAGLKDSELFFLLVFLYRMGLLRTNGRPRSRRFIEFLRGQFPQAPELKRAESRIIVP